MEEAIVFKYDELKNCIIDYKNKPSKFVEDFYGIKLHSFQKKILDEFYDKKLHYGYIGTRTQSRKLSTFVLLIGHLMSMESPKDKITICKDKEMITMNRDEFATYLEKEYWK